jgi:hypothetical protein
VQLGRNRELLATAWDDHRTASDKTELNCNSLRRQSPVLANLELATLQFLDLDLQESAMTRNDLHLLLHVVAKHHLTAGDATELNLTVAVQFSSVAAPAMGRPL